MFQSIIVSCIERREDCSNEYRSQLDTINRLIDVYSDLKAIYWSVWLYLTDVFTSIREHTYLLSIEKAERLLVDGIPVTLTMRLRLIIRIPEHILETLGEYSLLNDKLRPQYSCTFEQIFIPRGDYVTVINFLSNSTIRIRWNEVPQYLSRGNLYQLNISHNLGDII